ncbi:MAG: pyridoxamine 5'-phosphate oxidase family protein [Candidatus Heimdallarchaeaceae archaeon]
MTALSESEAIDKWKFLKNSLPLLNTMKRILIVSNPVRPYIPGYGISEEEEGMLNWDDVVERINESKNYWICTTRQDSKPHARPIWGIWLDNFFYFGGGDKTRTVRNILENNYVAIHTESGDKAVIVEGFVEKFEDNELDSIIGLEYEKRYGMNHPPPFWRVIPETVFAWSIEGYAKSPTKFRCSMK